MQICNSEPTPSLDNLPSLFEAVEGCPRPIPNAIDASPFASPNISTRDSWACQTTPPALAHHYFFLAPQNCSFTSSAKCCRNLCGSDPPGSARLSAALRRTGLKKPSYYLSASLPFRKGPCHAGSRGPFCGLSARRGGRRGLPEAGGRSAVGTEGFTLASILLLSTRPGSGVSMQG